MSLYPLCAVLKNSNTHSKVGGGKKKKIKEEKEQHKKKNPRESLKWYVKS